MISNKRTTPTVNVPIVRDPWIIRHNQRRTDGRGSTAKRMEGLNMKADPIGRKSHGSRAAAKTATTDGGQKQRLEYMERLRRKGDQIHHQQDSQDSMYMVPAQIQTERVTGADDHDRGGHVIHM